VDTIGVELKQIAVRSRELILTPGNYGSDYIAGHDLDGLGVPVLKFSNFLGETLDMIGSLESGEQDRRESASIKGIDTVLLVAHAGKLSKVAAGIMNTHSKYADGRNEVFCSHAAICGGSGSLCRELMEAATTDACIEILDREHLREAVIGSILQAVQEKLERRTAGRYRIGALMFSNVYGLLGMTEEGRLILSEWEEEKR
jgi:cobalt-precorrin-5B (C1)-methyltransferase